MTIGNGLEKMNVYLKKELVTALRSGEYKQGQKRLKKHDGCFGARHCCLGVACELSAKLGVGAWDGNEFVIVDLERLERENKSPTTLPTGLREFFGLSRDAVNQLITLNDHEGKSFDEIADWIEENL